MAEPLNVDRALLALLDPDGSFLARLAADRETLLQMAGGPTAGNWPQRLQELEIIAHRLGGTAGTFGFAAVSAAALELEDRVIAARENSGHRAKVDAGLSALNRALKAGLAAAP